MLPQMRNISERQFDNPVKHKNYYRKAAWQPCETQELLQKGSMTTLWNTRNITERQYDNPVKHKNYYRKAVWQPCETQEILQKGSMTTLWNRRLAYKYAC